MWRKISSARTALGEGGGKKPGRLKRNQEHLRKILRTLKMLKKFPSMLKKVMGMRMRLPFPEFAPTMVVTDHLEDSNE